MDKRPHIESVIVKYLNGTITGEEHAVLLRWIEESRDNRLYFDQVREIWLASEMNKKSFAFDAAAAFERFGQKTRRPYKKSGSRYGGKRRLKLNYGWAAVILLALFTWMGFQRWIYPAIQNTPELAKHQVMVPLGSRTSLFLPDGSEITLNAGSSLSYDADFGKTNRDLWLDGEGYFNVRSSGIPFTVYSGTAEFRVLGTQFNISAYIGENRIEATLVEGKLAVRERSRVSNGDSDVTISPNQKLTLDYSTHGGIPILSLEEVDVLHEISWKENKWVIYRESLGDLAVKLERRYDVKIIFADEDIKLFRYNGTLPDESIEQVLAVMKMVSPISYSIKGKTVIFSNNPDYRDRSHPK